MAKSIPLKPGDRVVIRPNGDPDSLVVRGTVETRAWNSFTQDYQYGIVVPVPDGEAHDVVIVHDFEIWGVLNHRTDH